MLGSLISKCYHWPEDLRYICLLSQGQPLRPGTPPPPDCMASTIWLAVSTSWPSIIMNSNAGLDRCHLPRSLIIALLDHENLYHSINAPLTFPCFASGKPIPRRKNSCTTTLSRPDIELLISTNITYLPKDSKLSPNYSLDPPHPFVKKNYDLGSVDKTPSWIYQSYSIHHTSNLSFGRRGYISSCCKINSTLATDTCKLNGSQNALLWNRDETFIKD